MNKKRELTTEEKLKLHAIANNVKFYCLRMLMCVEHLNDESLDCLCDSYQYIGCIGEFLSDMAGFAEEFGEHMAEYRIDDDEYATKYFHDNLGL